MDIAPILAALRRHKTASLLIVLEIAVACAILCNAVFLITERAHRMQQRSGIEEDRLVMIESLGLDAEVNAAARVATDLAALRAVPGVEETINVAQFPFASNTWKSSISLEEAQEKPTVTPNLVIADENYLKVSGLKLRQGRWFTPEEIMDADVLFGGGDVRFPVMVVTHALAEKLFPGENALGKTVYMGKRGTRIVGIVDDMLAPGGQPDGNAATTHMTFFLPTRTHMSWYVLRTAPERRKAVLKEAVTALNRVDGNRIIHKQHTLSEMRERYYSRDRAVSWLLVTVSAMLLAITAFGIGGLASFWVQRRTRQIGVRRALGATRGDILRYFQTENLLLASVGIALGMPLAYGVNQWLMSKYELPRLPLQYLPIGALMLWALGQLAVLWPALRAASIPPATATRSI